MNQFWSGNECEILTHSQQQPQASNAHKKESTVRLPTRITLPWAPNGLSFTGLRTQFQVQATHSNRQVQLETGKIHKDTFKGSLLGCFENVPNTVLTAD